MNKLKLALQELRSYLGRDQEGLRKLDAVTRLSNDLRKQVSSQTEQEQETLAYTQQLRREAQEKYDAIQTTRDELQHTHHQLAQTRRELAQALKTISSLTQQLEQLQLPPVTVDPDYKGSPTAECELLKDPRLLADLVDDLRRDFRVCPPGRQSDKDKRLTDFELLDVIQSFSPDQLIKLGRLVAVLAIMGYPVILHSSENYQTANYPQLLKAVDTSLKTNTGPAPAFTYWFRSHIQDPDRPGYPATKSKLLTQPSLRH